MTRLISISYCYWHVTPENCSLLSIYIKAKICSTTWYSSSYSVKIKTMACSFTEILDSQEAWMFMTSDLTEVPHLDLDLSVVSSVQTASESSESSFVADWLNDIDNLSYSSTSQDFSSNQSVQSDSFEDFHPSLNSHTSTSLSSLSTEALSVSSADEGIDSLENCFASINEVLNPEDFSALLDSLADAVPDNLLSSAVLGDACLNLSYCTSNQPTELKTHSTRIEKYEHNLEKPDISYIELVAKAIMSSPDNSILLADIYKWIEEQYPYYKTTKNSWRNSIRHNLSVNECFVKSKRVKSGRGFYWSIHSSCIDAFKNGDYDRRKARRQVQQCNRAFTSAFEELQHISRATSRPPVPKTSQFMPNSHPWVGARGFAPVASTPHRTDDKICHQTQSHPSQPLPIFCYYWTNFDYFCYWFVIRFCLFLKYSFVHVSSTKIKRTKRKSQCFTNLPALWIRYLLLLEFLLRQGGYSIHLESTVHFWHLSSNHFNCLSAKPYLVVSCNRAFVSVGVLLNKYPLRFRSNEGDSVFLWRPRNFWVTFCDWRWMVGQFPNHDTSANDLNTTGC